MTESTVTTDVLQAQPSVLSKLSRIQVLPDSTLHDLARCAAHARVILDPRYAALEELMKKLLDPTNWSSDQAPFVVSAHRTNFFYHWAAESFRLGGCMEDARHGTPRIDRIVSAKTMELKGEYLRMCGDPELWEEWIAAHADLETYRKSHFREIHLTTTRYPDRLIYSLDPRNVPEPIIDWTGAEEWELKSLLGIDQNGQLF